MENTIKKWEEYLHCEIADVHACDQHIDDNVLVFRDAEDGAYCLAAAWLAEEEDVREDPSFSVGDFLSSFVIAVNYCPYCGAKLE